MWGLYYSSQSQSRRHWITGYRDLREYLWADWRHTRQRHNCRALAETKEQAPLECSDDHPLDEGDEKERYCPDTHGAAILL